MLIRTIELTFTAPRIKNSKARFIILFEASKLGHLHG